MVQNNTSVLEVVDSAQAISVLTPDERRTRIISLAASAMLGAEATRRAAKKSTEEAEECGRLLLEEKHFNASKGKWGQYFEAHYAQYIPERTARNWMALASKHASNPALPEANRVRNGMLALDMFPNKVHEPIANNPRVSITNNHMASVIRFEAWYRGFRADHQANATQGYVRQLAKDCSKLIEFVDWLKRNLKTSV